MSVDTQSNTRVGSLAFRALERLTGMEGRLCFLAPNTDPQYVADPVGVLLATGQTDIVPYVLIEGGAVGSRCQVLPLHSGANVRILLSGASVLPGDLLVVGDGLEDPGARGTVSKFESGAAHEQRVVGVAEEPADDGALVLCRPYPELFGLTYPTPDNLVVKHLVSVALSAGATTGSVTGMDLPSLPLVVELNVEGPSDGDFISARVVAGSKTLDGFAYVLNSAPPATGYTLKGNVVI
jgi:hypothetical protein